MSRERTPPPALKVLGVACEMYPLLKTARATFFLTAVAAIGPTTPSVVPPYLDYLGVGRRRPTTVLTLHNLACPGQFKADPWSRLGLPTEAIAMQGLEYHGDIGYLKAGIHFADANTTVSPTYAREIRTLAGGMGLDPTLRGRDAAVRGIVNGIDTEVWNPVTDCQLVQTYDAGQLGARQTNSSSMPPMAARHPRRSPTRSMRKRW